MYKRTRIFIEALPYISDYLEERGVKPQKIYWIPNGINLDDFKIMEHDPSYDEVNEICNFMNTEREKGKMIVVYVGSFGRGKQGGLHTQGSKCVKG